MDATLAVEGHWTQAGFVAADLAGRISDLCGTSGKRGEGMSMSLLPWLTSASTPSRPIGLV